MRNSFFLRLALGLLSWSSQMMGAATEPMHLDKCHPNLLLCTDTRDDALPSQPRCRGTPPRTGRPKP